MRLRKLLGKVSDFDSDYYITELKNILMHELSGILEGNLTKCVYLENIQKRYGIKIKKTDSKSKVTYTQENIDKLGLSVRTSSCLKHAGISELQELSVEDMAQIRNFNRKCIEEIDAKLGKYTKETSCSLTFNYKGETTIYKYFDYDSARVAMSLYELIFGIDSSKTNVLEAHFSPGLLNILLLKGYIYAEDIYADSDLLKQQLQELEFENYVAEIDYLKVHIEDYFHEEGYVTVSFANNEIIDFIQNNNINTLEELKQSENERIKEFINNNLESS